MRNLTQLVITAIVIVLALSCVNSSSKTLPPLQIEIPAELKGNDEIVEFIENAKDAINNYSETAEKLAEDCKQFAGKNEEDLSVFDKVKMVATLGQYKANFAEFADQYSKMVEETEVFDKGLNDNQALALATVMDAFKERMEQLELKYKYIADQTK